MAARFSPDQDGHRGLLGGIVNPRRRERRLRRTSGLWVTRAAWARGSTTPDKPPPHQLQGAIPLNKLTLVGVAWDSAPRVLIDVQ